ncbi:MAG: hypothetical protein J5835_08380 [Bacteroidales bacterium]|nr:hypothetical protein [Bacteroidales bacterium]
MSRRAVILPFLMALLVAGCGMDPSPDDFYAPEFISFSSEEGGDDADETLMCTVTTRHGISRCGFLWGLKEGELTEVVTEDWTGNTFSAKISGMERGLLYEFTAFIEGGRDRILYGPFYLMLPMQAVIPDIPPGTEVVVTGDYAALSNFSVTLGGGLNIDSQLLPFLEAYGFQVGTRVVLADGLDKSQHFYVTVEDLSAGTDYTYKALARVGGTMFYGKERSFRTPDMTVPENGYVDLGLNVLWAACNLGAGSPEQTGTLYAWGETTPKEIYSWGNYIWCLGTEESIFKYGPDGKSVLEAADDAATVNLGGKWRTPTPADYRELLANCTWQEKTVGNCQGYLLTSTVPGYMDRSIFFLYNDNCWTSELCPGLSSGAQYFAYWPWDNTLRVFDYTFFQRADDYGRYRDRPVRPVCDR